MDRALTECLIFHKPYFGPALRALQGEPRRHAHMQAVVELLAKQSSSGPFKVLEVGSWAGGSAITWCKAIERWIGAGQVVCVDPWEPYFDTEKDRDEVYQSMNEAARSGLIYALFLHNVRSAGVVPMIVPIVGRSQDVLPTLAKSDFSVVYLDGAHDFAGVQSDIRLAMDLVKPGGILCGDDLELQAHQLDAAELAFDVDSQRDYVISKQHGISYHPGVTRGVADAFGEVSCWEGFWAMAKHAQGWEKLDLQGCGLVLPGHMRQTQGESAKVEDAELKQTVDMISQVAERINKQVPAAECAPDNVPELVATYHGYNIVRLGKFFYGVSHVIGEVDWSTPSAELAKRFGQINFITTEPSAVVEGVGLKELQGQIAKLSEAIATTLLRQDAALAAMERQVEAVRQLAERQSASTEALRQTVNATADARQRAEQEGAVTRQRLDDMVALVAKVEKDLRALVGDQCAAAQQGQEELQLRLRETRSEIQDLKSNALVRVGSYMARSSGRRGKPS